MKHLYDPARVDEVKQRLARLRPDSARQWGRMTPAQMLAHCCGSFDMALGDIEPPRMLLGYLFGRMAKRSLLHKGEPMRRNAPSTEMLIVRGAPDFAAERARLEAQIDRFVQAGPAGCTTHPHVFMGRLTPVEWAALMYQHLDHHLRQFGG